MTVIAAALPVVLPPASVTQDFDSYTPGTNLATLPGWTIYEGAFSTFAGGVASSGTSSSVCVAAYEPAGFTTAPNHQAEVLLGEGTITGNAQGVAVAIQPDGTCYHAYCEGDGTVYFGFGDGAGFGNDWISHSLGTASAAGIGVRLTVTGTGANRRCTAEINSGSGWFSPSGWVNRDFGIGKRLDGGKAGLAGFGSAGNVKTTSLTVTNLP